MRRYHVAGWLSCVILLASSGLHAAETAADPLRLVPQEAEIVFRLDDPRKIADTVYHLDAVQKLLKIDSVRELYDSTKFRRIYQLLAYFENQLGHERFDLLDRLAGGGIVIAGKFTGAPGVLAVVQARDQELLKKFVALGLGVIDQELARQEIKEKPRKAKYRDVETIQLDKAHAAIVGSAFLVASDAKTLHRAIDCYRGDGKSIAASKSLVEARKLLTPRAKGPGLVGWLWLDMDKIHTIPGYREGVKSLTLQPIFYFVIGPIFNVVERSPFVAVGFYQRDKNFEASVRMPRGREGMPSKAALFLPAAGDGAWPLLKPSNLLASFSYHIDLGKIWQHKNEWLSAAEAKSADEGEKKITPFLAGIKISKLLQDAGTHQRWVITQPKPNQRRMSAFEQTLSASALVLDMRDPAFGKSMETILRALGLLGSFQFDLKMVEEKHGPYTIVSYRFGANKKLKEIGRVLAEYSPCFVTVGDQFIVSATVDLAHELIDLVAAEKKRAPAGSSARFQLYSAGAAESMRAGEKQLRTQYILGQALSPAEADRQIRELIAVVQGLGMLDFRTHYGPRDFRYDIRLKMGE